MRLGWPRRAGIWLLTGAMAACGPSPGGEAPAGVVQQGRPGLGAIPTFVGRAACAACHRRELSLWTGSDHDRAMQRADPRTVLGDFDRATFTAFDLTTTFTTRGGRFFVETEGADGELREYEVAYTFGVDPLQQYLVEWTGGRYQALSLAWDTRPAALGGQRWFHLYPDERITSDDALHWTKPAHNWNANCAECHSTNVRKGFRPVSNEYETTWSEIDVSCEACHGPGSAHVGWAQAVAQRRPRDRDENGLVLGLPGAQPAVWRFDLTTGIARRDPPRQSRTEIETCARCHSRRSAVADPYLYGRPLLDSHRPALLRAPLYYADGQVRDEVYVYGSFLQSKMYAAGVTCSDCHDPHDLSVRGEGNDACAGCHLPDRFDATSHHDHEPGTPGASCVVCHMPARTYMQVDSRRDHSFRVPRPDLTVKLGSPNACSSCHVDRSPAWAVEALVKRHGPPEPHFGEALQEGEVGTATAERALLRLAGDTTAPAIARATALDLLPRPGTRASIPVIQRALAASDPLIRLGAVGALGVVEPRARGALGSRLLHDPVRAVRLEAARLLAGTPPGAGGDAQRAILERALDEYRESQRVNADRPEAHVNLGLLHVQRGELEDAEREYRTALEIGPDFLPTYLNLADLYREQRRDAAAERLLRQALAGAPDSAAAHHSLGLTLVRQGRRDLALTSLRRAAALAPDEARFSYVLGLALRDMEGVEPALAVLRVAHARHAGDRDILVALVTISREAGEVDQALEYAIRLLRLDPLDLQVRRLVDRLRRATRQ